MKSQQDLDSIKEEYLNTEIPQNGLQQMEIAIQKAKLEKRRLNHMKKFKTFSICTAAVLALFFIIPNVSSTAAMAMEKIPVLGSIIRVITFDRYEFSDENHEAKVEIPKVETDSLPDTPLSDSVDIINKEITDYTATLIKAFEKDILQYSEARQALDITYETVTDSETWFTLKISILETAASGAQSFKYYHIDKASGQIVTLKDLFLEGSDYVSVISQNIQSQMRQKMKEDENLIYFIDDEDMPENNFDKIKEDQNFYFDKDNQLVIAFDEYEAAPGYMGSPEFVISKNVIQTILK